ncbi:hypothetical protein A7X68_09555 [Stenotrophomonas maltophilia]|nr:hypothetical protein AS591_21790 [Stenotrophomonas maltophilia]PZS59771.1 hypothetical protein A7X58_06910 [Stenotrophomonas maltophilia]PZS67599.1 hypothetical protein A7X68_09555 [Stenotrophomonas maltophilia]
MARELRRRNHELTVLNLRNRLQQWHRIAEGIEATGIDEAQYTAFNSLFMRHIGLRIETLRNDM